MLEDTVSYIEEDDNRLMELVPDGSEALYLRVCVITVKCCHFSLSGPFFLRLSLFVEFAGAPDSKTKFGRAGNKITVIFMVSSTFSHFLLVISSTKLLSGLTDREDRNATREHI